MVRNASRKDPIRMKVQRHESKIQSAIVVMRNDKAIAEDTRPIVTASVDHNQMP